MHKTIRTLAASAAFLFSVPVFAQMNQPDLSSLFYQLVGYKILGVGTINGFMEGGKRGENFEGCTFGRKILIDDGALALQCTESSREMMFAMQPKVVVFTNGMQMRMLVEGRLYRVGPAM
jgi:hypothetical protein